MALQTATNPDTGERFALVDNEWVPFSKTASNPDTGEKFGLIKDQWMPLNIKAAVKPLVPVKPPEPRPEDQSMLRQVADVPLKVGAGVVSGVRMIADAFGADSSVSKTLRGVEDDIAALYSAQSKKDSREIARIMKEAEDKGVLDQIVAGVKAMSVAPVDVMANALGTSAPAIAAGLLTTLTGGAPIVATGLGVGTGALMGAGTIKSAIYDATKQVLSEKTKMSPEQIEAAAIKAQEYGGKNLDQILIGAGLTAASSITGAEPVIARQLAKEIVGRTTAEEAAAAATKQLTGREATKAAIRAAAEEETKKAAERGVIKQGAITAGKEFLGESAEGGQEQMAQNIALQRQGFDVPTMQGVVSQATLEGLAGLGMGAVGGGREAYKAKQEIADKAAGGQDLKNLFTTYDEERKTKAPQADAEQLALIDADTRVKQEEAPLPPKTTATGSADAKSKALAYVDELTADPNKKPNSSKLKGLLTELGIDVPAGKGYNTRALQALQMYFGYAPTTGEVTSETDTTAGGAGARVDATADTTANAPAAPVDTTGDLGGAGTTVPPSGGGTVGGARVELGSLSQETQDEINNRRDEVLNLIEDGAATRLITNKLNFLNRLEEKHGVELFKPSSDGLPAKGKYTSVQKLIDQGKGAVATTQDTTPAAPKGVSVDAAIQLADMYDKRAEAERQRLLEESRGEPLPNIKVDQAVVDEYNATREEINRAADEHNKTRTGMSERLKQLYEDSKNAELESERIDDQLEAAKLKGDEKAVAKLGEQANEATRRAEDLVAEIAAAEKELQAHGGTKNKLPNWDKEITPAEKEVYLDNIRNNTIEEHNAAAKALLDFRRKQGIESREGEGTLNRQEQRLIKGYEDNRPATSKAFGFKFPEWGKLSDLAKSLYFREVANNAGLQQDVGFAKVAEQIIKENKELSEKQKAEAMAQIGKHQRRVRIEAERNRRRLERLNRNYNRRAILGIGKGVFLPDKIVQMIKDNNVQGVLQYLRANKEVGGPHKKVFKALAQALFNMKLNVKIQVVESLPDGRLAEYDPSYKDSETGQIGLISVTPEGLTAHTVLHEIIHAGTLKVLYKFIKGDTKSLTPEQIDACEQLQDIMEETKEYLGDIHVEAYKNLIEFVAYALTDQTLQQDLAQFESEKVIATTVLPDSKKGKGGWSQFKLAIAGVLNLAKTYFYQNKVRADAPVNYFLEVSAAMEDILSPQDEQIYLPKNLAAKKKEPKKAPEGKKTREGGLADPELRKAYELSDAEYPPSKLAKAVKDLFTVQGWRNKATAFVDTTYEIVSRERRNDLGGKIIRNLDDAFNNVAEQLALSTGEKLQFLTHYLDQPLTDFKAAFADWMKLTGESFKEASATIHMLAEMFHEPERRKALFVQMVPLKTDKTFNVGGKMISAAERRTQILGDRATGTPGLIDQVELTDAQKKKLWAELTNLAENHNDAYGYSPNPKIGKPKNAEQAKLLTDINSDTYTALGINMDEVKLRQEQFAAMPEKQQEAANKIFASLKNLTDATKELNQIGHYWSFPVSNITGMFDYQYYLPFKNNKDNASKPTEKDYYTDPEAISRGVSLQEVENKTHGRFAVSVNPLLQVMSDAYRSADRAGRRNLTQSIKNALPKSEKNPNGTGVILGNVRAHIPFAERDKTDMSQFKGGANIFHYNDDGSIDVLQVGEEHILEAIRYAFKHEKPLVDLANAITGWVGAQHTRYNVNFAPKNFVTDMFTNAWNMGGGMMGPLAAPKYVGLVATRVLQNGLGKAWEIALLNEKGDEQSQQRMANSAKKDPFVRDMLELIKYGGKTAYIESFSIKNNTEKLKKLEKNSWIADTKESIDNLLDTWSSMFELTSRTAAYGMFREYYYKKNLEKNMDEKSAYQAACTQAAAETKNLTNFEKVGTYGRELGALYMFIRPSAISATRAIETAAPAFTTLDVAKRHMPAAVQNDPAAVEEYIKNFKQLRTNSQIMIATLMGAGYATYWMAMMMAPDDEWKRNSVRTDNMQQWTRNARFHMPDSLGLGRDIIIQIPWGFGLGAFPAIGAQIGGMYHGQTSIKDGLGNIAGSILTDSFLPIPISKIPVSEQPLKWAFDSVVPSVLRPISEYIMNMNGIGQAINSATMRRFGDAFTGGDRIPEVYKDFTAWLYNKTQGAWDVSPNTAYFLTNSYIDGIARIGEMSYNWVDLSKGEKAFNPKTDLALLGSFFGSKSNVDAREFSSIQEKIKDLDTRLKTLNKTNRATAIEFRADHPGVENAISVYNQQVARLDKIRKRANEIRAMEIPPIDKQELLRLNILQQNMLKHEIIERLKVYGVEP
jgi:Large polyvalent protein associated domain 38